MTRPEQGGVSLSHPPALERGCAGRAHTRAVRGFSASRPIAQGGVL
ncbi:hypothetical protein ACFYWY_14945 [Streptomyces sp. NPDC002870]